MPDQFFKKFPKMVYANTNCIDITRRVVINADIKDNIDLFYPIEIQAGFRPDQLTEAAYQEEELDWMMYLMNGIVDPYYEWYISDIDFNDFLLTKYDSVANSQERIIYYRNNWYEDETQITPEAYNTSIDMAWRKYYEPVFTPTNKIYSYRRKQEDWVVNTNRILQYNITYANSNITFSNNEIVDIKVSGEFVGGGTCIVSNSTTLIIHHVSGNTSANTTATKTILGETSGANATANALTVLSENFTEEEGRFWSNVSFYDVELELWESRKTVEVINSDLILNITEDVYNKLRE